MRYRGSLLDLLHECEDRVLPRRVRSLSILHPIAQRDRRHTHRAMLPHQMRALAPAELEGPTVCIVDRVAVRNTAERPLHRLVRIGEIARDVCRVHERVNAVERREGVREGVVDAGTISPDPSPAAAARI